MSARSLVAAIALAAIIAPPAASAEGTPLPWTYRAGGVDAAGAVNGADPGVDAVSSPTKAPSSSRFLGFKDKESFHRFSGWMSGGILLASGVVGAVHAYGMMETAHEYRDSIGTEDEFNSALCVAEIRKVYEDPSQQALRWTHVGLLAAGESFYLANALTGAEFMSPLPPGWSRAKIHRYAFFIHAGLMVTEGILGFLSTDALERGDHETFTGLLAAHAGIGIAIPLTILGAGAIMGRGTGP
jgi:hypothetical protein